MRPIARVIDRLDELRGALFVWAPVLLGTGIGGYFVVTFEPGLNLYVPLVALSALCLVFLWMFGARIAPVFWAFALLSSGFLLAGLRAHMVAAPVLGFGYYGPVEGRVVVIDRSQSDKPRLTLDQVVLERTAPGRTPGRVRISLHGDWPGTDPAPGMRVMTTAHLSGPAGPVEPGGFDFQRMAWFRGIGAVGYTRNPVMLLEPPGPDLRLARLRARISAWVQAELPGEAGAFAAAVMTGDRAGMRPETLAALRGANLAHLLAISGLHMGLLTGFVFAFLRYALALLPGIALRFATKKIAAVGALLAGGFYLALSGVSVATERAFVMVAVMFLALLIDRRAITLRAVAIAALVVLVRRPETLMEPGFQMSFAATTALVGVFGALRDWRGWSGPGWARRAMTVVLSSAVAAAATAPFAAAHFNQVSHFGLLANVLSVPVMGAVVMPGAVLAACLAPFGLAGLALALMRPAIDWILFVAGWVSGLQGAVGQVPAPQGIVLPLIALGGLFVVLWPGRMRLAGVLALGAALLAWATVERPQVLVSSTGRLVGVMTAGGRALSRPRGDGFAARSWLENDGDPVSQDIAAARPGFRRAGRMLVAEAGGLGVVHLHGKGVAEQAAAPACASADLVVSSTQVPRPSGGCLFLDPGTLRRSGAVAVSMVDGTLRLRTGAGVTGRRLWNTRP